MKPQNTVKGFSSTELFPCDPTNFPKSLFDPVQLKTKDWVLFLGTPKKSTNKKVLAGIFFHMGVLYSTSGTVFVLIFSAQSSSSSSSDSSRHDTKLRRLSSSSTVCLFVRLLFYFFLLGFLVFLLVFNSLVSFCLSSTSCTSMVSGAI
jgi:hypothetical protein